jgi:hypothetical protein
MRTSAAAAGAKNGLHELQCMRPTEAERENLLFSSGGGRVFCQPPRQKICRGEHQRSKCCFLAPRLSFNVRLNGALWRKNASAGAEDALKSSRRTVTVIHTCVLSGR